jgi:hypothetical protein
MNLAQKVLALKDELLKQLNKFNKILISDNQYDEGADFIYEMPQTYKLDKHGYHKTYVIMEITPNGVLRCGGLYEDYGEFTEVNLNDLSIDTLVDLFFILN